MKTLSVDYKAIKALLPLAAENDIRYHLNGVHVVFTDRSTTYEATTGTVVGRVEKGEASLQDGEPTIKVILPREAVKQLKIDKKQTQGTLTINDDGTLRLQNPGAQQDFTVKAVDGVFPDVQRAIPAKTNGEAGNYDVTLLALFSLANKGFGSKRPGQIRLVQNGPNDTARVELPSCPDFVGAIAPFRF